MNPFLSAGLASFSLFVAASVHAETLLPNPTPGEEICYIRVYSEAHLRAHPEQKAKGIALTFDRPSDFPDQLYSSITVTDRNGESYFGAGAVLTSDGRALGKLPAISVAAQMDGDAGRYLVTQDQKKIDQIHAKVISALILEQVTTIPEQNEMKTLVIDIDSADSSMILERQAFPEGSGMDCETQLQDEIAVSE